MTGMGRVWRYAVRGLILVAVLGVLGGAFWLSAPARPTDASERGVSVVVDPRYNAIALDALESARDVAAASHLPSLSIAVAVDDSIVWQATVGYADLEAHSSAVLATRYRLGSTAKSVTAVALGRLLDADVLRLDTRAGDVLPGLPDGVADVTVRQLASHTAGVPHYANPFKDFDRFRAEQFSSVHYASPEDALGIFIDAPLLFEPGTSFNYSTHGFTLLSAIMERAAGRPFLDLLADEVFRPFGMSDAGPDDVTSPLTQRAHMYGSLGGRFIPAFPDPDPSYKWAGGGLLATPTDLARFGAGLLTGALLSDSVRSALFTEQLLSNGSHNPQGYALGWRIGKAVGVVAAHDTTTVVHHGGSSPGGSSFLVMIPRADMAGPAPGGVTVAVMTNRTLSASGAMRAAAIRIGGRFLMASPTPTGSLGSGPPPPPASGN